jgi:hypothetical protein
MILLGEISGRCGFLRSTRATARIAMAPRFTRLEGSAGPSGSVTKTRWEFGVYPVPLTNYLCQKHLLAERSESHGQE